MSNAATKTELINDLTARSGLKKQDVNAVLEALEQSIAAFVNQDKAVTIPGICKMHIRTYQEGEVRNPRTGEMQLRPAGKKLKISPATNLKAAIKPI